MDWKRGISGKKGIETVGDITANITKYSGWKRKILEEENRLKWRKRIIRKGAAPADVDRVFSSLLWKVIGEDTHSDVHGLELLRSNRNRNDPDLDLEFYEYSAKPRDDLIFKDKLVPESLRKLLDKQLEQLARAEFPRPNQEPISEKVLNIIDPSMYPYIRGLSWELNPNTLKDRDANSVSESDLMYQWLPAEFKVNNFGSKVRFLIFFYFPNTTLLP